MTSRTVHKLIASSVAALLLLARPCLGSEPLGNEPLGNESTTIDTRGFSVTFGEVWHVSTDHNGTILGGISGEKPPFIIIYYADRPMNADPVKGSMFERMKQSSIADMIGDGMRGMVDASKWHRHDIVHRPDGVTEEQLDLYADSRDGDGQATELCSFIRFYHGAPHAELYLAFSMSKPCGEARAEFDSFEKSIIWK